MKLIKQVTPQKIARAPAMGRPSLLVDTQYAVESMCPFNIPVLQDDSKC